MRFTLRRRLQQPSKEPARGRETGLSQEVIAQGYQRSAEGQRLAAMNTTSPMMLSALFGGAVQDSRRAEEIRRTPSRAERS